MDETNQLPTHLECPQCNTKLRPFMVQSQNPNIDVELDRCHGCGGVWFDRGELELSTGRKVTPTKVPVKDRYCPRCLIPLLGAELTGNVAVEACRSCKGVYLDSRDMLIVTRKAPAKPPETVTFKCDACGQRKPFAHAQSTAQGLTECSDCYAKEGSPTLSKEQQERASVFSSFISWLRRD
jgi:Zn-finger nucleic acid-binding protein